MNSRALLSPLWIGTSIVVTAAFVACASDETTGDFSPDAATIPLDTDASDDVADASDASDAAPADPCVPDALCPGGPFDPSTAGGALDVRTRINFLRGRSPSDVWAIGARGAAAHFDGTSWRSSDTGTLETLNGLWLRATGEIALATLFSTYAHDTTFDIADAGAPSAGGWIAYGKPSGPTEVSKSSGSVSSTWTTPDAEWLWCTTNEKVKAGLQPAANGLWRLHVTASNTLEIGNAFTAATCGQLPCRQMTSIHGISADDLWAVGYTGATFHITDAQTAKPVIQPYDSQTWAELDGVWVASASEAWAVGGGGTIRHYTGQGTAWDIVSDVPTTSTLNAVWGSSPSDVWAVGDGAVVLHYDGASWSRVSVAGLGGRTPDLYTVWTPSPGHVWIGGDGVVLSLGGEP